MRTTTMRKLTASILATTLAGGVIGVTETPAHAQEIVLTGPLKGAPPVIKLRQYREGRLEIAPQFSFTLLDEYQHSYFIGGRINYYFTDWLAFGVWGGGFINSNTDLTSQIDNIAPRDKLDQSNVAPCIPSGPDVRTTAGSGCTGGPGTHPTFSDQTATLSWAAMGQFTAVPFRGKLALFQALFVDTEAYLFLGAGVVGLNERISCGDPSVSGQPSCNDAASFALGSQVKFVPTFGIGLTFFFNDIVNLGIEYRALPFSWNRGGFDSRGLGPNNNFPDGKVNGDDETFKFNQVIGISVGVMLGKRKTSQ
jgi:outer membrane beta-barrel protein